MKALNSIESALEQDKQRHSMQKIAGRFLNAHDDSDTEDESSSGMKKLRKSVKRLSALNIATSGRHSVKYSCLKGQSFFDVAPSPQERDLLGRALTSVDLMRKTNQLLQDAMTHIFGTDNEQSAEIESQTFLDTAVRFIHEAKWSTARVCWRDAISGLREQLSTTKSKYEDLKAQMETCRLEYLEEVSMLRDQKRVRADPDEYLKQCAPTNDVIMKYDPAGSLHAEESGYVLKAVTEKLKMIFETNPRLVKTVDLGQLDRLKSMYESKQVLDLKEELRKKNNELAELKRILALMESQGGKPSENKAYETRNRIQENIICDLQCRISELNASSAKHEKAAKSLELSLQESEAARQASDKRVNELTLALQQQQLSLCEEQTRAVGLERLVERQRRDLLILQERMEDAVATSSSVKQQLEEQCQSSKSLQRSLQVLRTTYDGMMGDVLDRTLTDGNWLPENMKSEFTKRFKICKQQAEDSFLPECEGTSEEQCNPSKIQNFQRAGFESKHSKTMELAELIQVKENELLEEQERHRRESDQRRLLEKQCSLQERLLQEQSHEMILVDAESAVKETEALAETVGLLSSSTEVEFQSDTPHDMKASAAELRQEVDVAIAEAEKAQENTNRALQDALDAESSKHVTDEGLRELVKVSNEKHVKRFRLEALYVAARIREARSEWQNSGTGESNAQGCTCGAVKAAQDMRELNDRLLQLLKNMSLRLQGLAKDNLQCQDTLLTLSKGIKEASNLAKSSPAESGDQQLKRCVEKMSKEASIPSVFDRLSQRSHRTLQKMSTLQKERLDHFKKSALLHLAPDSMDAGNGGHGDIGAATSSHAHSERTPQATLIVTSQKSRELPPSSSDVGQVITNELTSATKTREPQPHPKRQASKQAQLQQDQQQTRHPQEQGKRGSHQQHASTRETQDKKTRPQQQEPQQDMRQQQHPKQMSSHADPVRENAPRLQSAGAKTDCIDIAADESCDAILEQPPAPAPPIDGSTEITTFSTPQSAATPNNQHGVDSLPPLVDSSPREAGGAAAHSSQGETRLSGNVRRAKSSTSVKASHDEQEENDLPRRIKTTPSNPRPCVATKHDTDGEKSSLPSVAVQMQQFDLDLGGLGGGGASSSTRTPRRPSLPPAAQTPRKSVRHSVSKPSNI